MRSRRSGRRARLMTKTWKRQGRRVQGVGAKERRGKGTPTSDPSLAGSGDLPHQTPSWWDSLGAGTHEPRPTWEARPLQRKAPPIMSPYSLISGDPRVLAPSIPTPSAERPAGRALRSHNPPASLVETGRLRPSGERGLPRVRERVRGETGTPSPMAHQV